MKKTDGLSPETSPPPLPEIHGRRLFVSSPERQAQEQNNTEKLTRYRRDYWQSYKQQIKRVFGTLAPNEYAHWELLAGQHGRTVWSHIYTCACAYLAGQMVVPSDVLDMQTELAADLRRIGNNLNQAVRLGHIKAGKEGRIYAEPNDHIGQAVLSALKTLEQRVCQFESDITLITPPTSSQTSHDR